MGLWEKVSKKLKDRSKTGNNVWESIKVLEKEGVGIFKERNGFYLTSKFAQYFSFGKRWSTEIIFKGRVSLIRAKQPYNKYKSLGYFEDYLRGYEFYVVDGLDYGYFKSSLRFEIINERVNWGKLMPVKPFKLMPLRIPKRKFSSLEGWNVLTLTIYQ